MTKKRTTLEDLDEELRKAEGEGRPYEEVMALYDTLVAKAVSLGIYNDDNILDGLDVVIRVAKTIHSMNR